MAGPLFVCLAVVGQMLSVPRAARAQASMPAAASSAVTTRNYLQSAYTRVRPASLLKAGAREMRPSPVEVRGPFSLELDGENQKHYARIAELDILFELTAKEKAVALEERVDATTRREMSRYFRRLQILRARAVTEERSRL